MRNQLIRLLFILQLVGFVSFSGQGQPDIAIDFKNKTVTFNNASITIRSTLTDIRKAIGSENRALAEDNNPTRLYIYDSLGIDFVIDTVKNILQKLTIRLSKGRGDFDSTPENLFTGKLLSNNKSINTDDKIEAIRLKTNLPFKEWAPGFYWYSADNEEFSVTIAYRDKKRDVISTVYILFSEDKE